jgi:hypothetical protein
MLARHQESQPERLSQSPEPRRIQTDIGLDSRTKPGQHFSIQARSVRNCDRRDIRLIYAQVLEIGNLQKPAVADPHRCDRYADE